MDDWVPVALTGDVETGSATGVHVLGRELVVWRDAAGFAHVWEDRCPHRGMRLSFGFVRGDRLACLYHGWQFDGTGRCRYVPAHPQLDVPQTITANRYASAEQGGLVWVSLSEGAPAAPPPVGNAEILAVRSLAIAAPHEQVIAAVEASASPIADGERGNWERTGLMLTCRTGAGALHVAVQPISAAGTMTSAQTMLHLGVDPASGARRADVSAWAQALRRDVEGQSASQASRMQASVAA